LATVGTKGLTEQRLLQNLLKLVDICQRYCKNIKDYVLEQHGVK